MAEPPGRDERPQYTVYRTRPRLFARGDSDAMGRLRASPDRGRQGAPARRRRLSRGRVAAYVLGAIAAWLALSLLLFLVSAQIEHAKVANATEAALDSAGYPLTSATTILVLGSDARTKSTNEPGSRIGGPSRSDSIMLMRVGAGHSARLSIPRDTIVDIPGRGRDKINAAYAIGGAALAIETVKAYLGLRVNHVVEVSFDDFPQLIDAMGGITYNGGCVVSKINGGFSNGGYTLRLRKGKTKLDGKQALALARTRKNDCNPKENDLTRARRQQKIFSGMRNRLVHPLTFVRLPFVSWAAPKTIRSDMAGPSLTGVVAALVTGGSPETRILGAGGNPLEVTDDEKRRAVRRFLRE